MILFFVCGFCLLPATLLAQSSEKQRVIEVMRALSERYKSYKGLSFTIAYRYASEDQPAVYLDSLKGSFTMSGSRYHYIVDSTEFIGGNDLSMTLFKEDKIMYLTRTSKALQSTNPLAMLDSFLTKNDNVDCELSETNATQSITMKFKPGMTVKRIEYRIDRASGLVTKMINVVQSKQLYDPSVRPLVKGASSYAIVETDFLNYREENAGGSVPDLDRYFKKEGKEYVTVPPYEAYKIFLGTPDL